MGKLNVLCCAYRDWAIHAVDDFADAKSANSPDEMWEMLDAEFFDTIIFIGWSWIIPEDTLNRYRCLCVHPSDLPRYRGGSPIQNQIIDGLQETKVTLFRMTAGLDAGPIIAQEDLNLRGSLDDILYYLTDATRHLLIDANLRDLGRPQDDTQATFCQRRTPEQSEITEKDLITWSSEQLYNKIRALQDPYPNAFIQCADGTKLYITEAKLDDLHSRD